MMSINIDYTCKTTLCEHNSFISHLSLFAVIKMVDLKKYKPNIKHMSGISHAFLTTTMYMHLGDYHKFVFVGLY